MIGVGHCSACSVWQGGRARRAQRSRTPRKFSAKLMARGGKNLDYASIFLSEQLSGAKAHFAFYPFCSRPLTATLALMCSHGSVAN